MTNTTLIAIIGALLLAVVVLFIRSLVLDRDKGNLEKALKVSKHNNDVAVEMYEGLRNYYNDRIIPVRASYCVSDSDFLKYKTDKAMEKAVKKALLNSLSDEIVKTIGEPCKIGDVYEYNIKIVK